MVKAMAESMETRPKRDGRMALFKEYANLRQDMERAILLYPEEKESISEEIVKVDELRKVCKVKATKISFLDVLFTVVRLVLLLIIFLCGGLMICCLSPLGWVLDPLLQICGASPAMQLEGLICRYLF